LLLKGTDVLLVLCSGLNRHEPSQDAPDRKCLLNRMIMPDGLSAGLRQSPG
jgi:hypothetical protein